MICNPEALKANIAEYLESNCLDMEDDFNQEEIESIVIELCKSISAKYYGFFYIVNENGQLKFKHGLYHPEYFSLIVWSNSEKPHISYSAGSCTGVSKCECKLDPEENYDYIIDMVNEAWYRCKN